MKMREHTKPSPPSLDQGNSAQPHWINAATSGLILAGLASFIVLVASMFDIGSEDLSDKYLHLWFRVFWYTVCGSAFLSIGLAALRFRLSPTQRVESDSSSPRRGYLNLAAIGLIPIGIAAAFATSGALTYMQLLDVLDSGFQDINPVWYTAFWFVPAGVGGVALIATLACLRFRLYLTLSWIIAVGFFLLVMFAILLNQTLEGSAAAFFDPFSIQAVALGLLVAAGLIWCLRKNLQQQPRATRSRVAFATTASGAIVLTLFATGIWVVSHQAPPSGPVVQPTPHPVTWEAVRSIIARNLVVPEEKVTPDARLREDLEAQGEDIQIMLGSFEKEFGIVAQQNDEDIIHTAADAFALAQDPEAFRARARDSR
jgi:acyl carrier protein